MTIKRIKKDWHDNKYKYFMVAPVVLFFLIFHYLPMFGVVMAFQDYRPALGVLESEWVGFKNFTDFFNSYYFLRLLKNTFFMSLYDLVVGFPAPIIFALLLNEIRIKVLKKTVQTISYMPYFISMVVMAGIIIDFFSSDGAITKLVESLGGPSGNLIGRADLFRDIFVGTNIWQGLGFGSIIYLAALSGIDQQLYEAAIVDGAGRFKQMIHVTLPGIASTIIVLLILRMGRMMTVNFEKIILLYSPSTYSTGDVIQSFTYRKGIQEFNYSYSTAVGLFNSLMNFGILLFANWMSKRYSETSLF